MSVPFSLAQKPSAAPNGSDHPRVVRGTSSARLVILAGFCAAAVLAGGVLAVNRFGIAVTPDSAHYLSAARNLAAGNGLAISQVVTEAQGTTLPYTAWPPLYPALVAAAAATGTTVLKAAVLVNAAAMILLALAVAGLAAACLSPRAGLGALLALAGLPALLEISAFAWSEAAFMAFTYAGFWLLAVGLPERRPREEWLALTAAGVLMALSAGTRYLGLSAAVAAGAALLLYHGGRPFRFLAARCAVVTGPAALVTAAWVIRNLGLTGEAAGQPRLSPEYDLPGICAAMAGFLLGDLSGDHPADLLIGGVPVRTTALVLFGAAVIVLVLAGGKRLLRSRYERIEPAAPVLLPMFLFVLVYFGSVALLGSLVHRLDPPTTRFLSAGYPALILIAAISLDLVNTPAPDIGPLSGKGKAMVNGSVLVLVLLLWSGAARFLLTDDGAPDGKLWPYWRTRVWAMNDPDGAAALTRLPARAAVWTNVCEYMDLVGGRPARRLPLAGSEDAAALLAAHPGPVYVDTRFARGVLTRDDLMSLSRGENSRIHFEGDLGHVALFHVEP